MGTPKERTWRQEIKAVLQSNSRRYGYTPDGQFDSSYRPYSPLSVKKISRPLRRPLQLPEGKYDFVIVEPVIKKLLGMRRVTIVINDRTQRPHFHGDLAGTRDVVAAGSFIVDKETSDATTISALINDSGHYIPYITSLDVAEKIMKIYHFPLSTNLQKKPYWTRR